MPVIPENIINLQTDSVPQTIINIDISDSGAIFAEIALAQANIATQSANTASEYANTALGYANDASHSADVAEGHSDDASAAADRSEAARDAAEELIPGVGRVGDFLQKTVDGAQWASFPEGIGTWGGIIGDIRNQTDLQETLAEKFDNPVNTGTAGQLLSRNADGDGVWVDAPNSAVWGLIQGNIKEQTDLQNEFEHGVELTKAEYDALPSSKETDNVNYWIKDGTNLPAMSVMSANGVMYDNTDSGLTSTTVQGAVDELNNGLTTLETTTGNQLKLHRFTVTVNRSIEAYGTIDVSTSLVIPADFDSYYLFSQHYAGNPRVMITNYFRASNGTLSLSLCNASNASRTVEFVFFKFLILSNTQVG